MWETVDVGVEGAEWEQLFYKCEIYPNPGVDKKARALWSMREAEANGDDYYDRSSERQTA